MGEPRKDHKTSDLYRQLLDSNDLVRELDDIEAISQQISQHAEVLYQNWKSHNRSNSTPPEGTANRFHTLRHSMTHEPGPGGGLGGEQGKFLTLPARTSFASGHPSSPSSTPVSPSPPTQTQSSTALDLLAAPEVSGNLKDLVSNFVSTDRAKQAARQSQVTTLPRPSDIHKALPTIFNNHRHGHAKGGMASPVTIQKDAIPIPVKHEEGPHSGVSSAKYLFEPDGSLSTPLSVLRPRHLSASTRSLFHHRKSVPAPPHPELTPQQKQNIFERSSSLGPHALAASSLPIHRFRNSGSVAERVLIFEKCPPVFSSPPNLINDRSTARPSSYSGAPSKLIPIHNLKNSEEGVGGMLNNASKLRNRHSIAVSPSFGGESDPSKQYPSKENLGPRIIREIPIKKLDPPKPFSTPSETVQEKPSSIINNHSSNSPAAYPSRSEQQPIIGGGRPFVSGVWSPPSSITSNNKVVQPKPKATSLAPKAKVTLRKDQQNKKAPKEVNLPCFYFPSGNPSSRSGSLESILQDFAKEFSKFGGSVSSQEELGTIFKARGVSFFWKGIVYNAALGKESSGSGGGVDSSSSSSSSSKTLSFAKFSDYWRKVIGSNYDEASQFYRIVSKGREGGGILPDDLVPLIQDVVDTHPGLGFLKDATDFHSRYVHTVIARIFFSVNRSWSGKISVSELRRSNFLPTLRLLSEEEDINRITHYFSYEHFYVIYCKFWELDTDHDLFIDREDLSQHNDQAISSRMIDRIFSGTVTRGTAQKEGKMSYTEFVWFLLAEEDKRSPTSIEYWFRCMDLDGDGCLSMYELEYFYEEQLTRMEQLGIETLPFEDCLCQMLDMIMPKERNRISLRDLKACRMTPIFFDTFFNLEKYLDHEQRDPFASQRELDEDGNEISDWDRFAADEYELLVAEEGNNENMDRLEMNYDDLDPDLHLGESYDKEGGGGVPAESRLNKSSSNKKKEDSMEVQ